MPLMGEVPGQYKVDGVLAALKEKYGQSAIPNPYGMPNQFYWYYDSAGKLLAEQPPGCSIIPFGWTDGGNGISQEPTLLNSAIPCGTFVRADIAVGPNKALALSTKVFMLDGPLQATHYKAARAAAIEYARQQKANETGEAAKRGGGKF